MLQGFQNSSESISSLCDSGGFAEGLSEVWIVVYLIIQLELEDVLGLLH